MSKAFVKKKKRFPQLLKIFLPIAFFAVIVIFVVAGIQNVAVSAQEERLKSMEQAVRRAAVQCYAIEGRYPGSIDYLAKNYGLILDRDQFIYYYQGVGSNLMPDISVFAVK